MTLLSRLAIVPPTLIGVLLVWQATASAPSPPTVELQERRVPVAYVTTQPRPFAPRAKGYGTVEPARVWSAVVNVAGPVVYLHPAFVRGGFVRAGTVLARIAPRDYELALQRAAADLAAAEARLEEIKVSEGTTSALLAIEREALGLAEADLARAVQLAEKGTVSPAVSDERRRNVLTQRAKVQTHENALALLPAQIASAKHAVAAAHTSHDAAALDVMRTVIKAPFDARVADVDVEISQFVGVGTAIGTLDGAEAAEIDVQVPQNQMAALAQFATGSATQPTDRQATPLGTHGTVQRTSAPGPLPTRPQNTERLSARVSLNLGTVNAHWPARVVRLSEKAGAQSRSVGVIVRVEAPYAPIESGKNVPLIKGMFVRAELSAPPIAKVTLLPRAAVRNGKVMLAGSDNRLAYADVTPLFVTDDLVVLAHGDLPDGTRVVTSGPSPAIGGLLLAPEPDPDTERRLDAAASGEAL